MHAIRTKDEEAQQHAVHWMNHSSTVCTIKRGSELQLTDGTPLVWKPKKNSLLIDLEWTEEEQAHLKTRVEKFTSQCASGAWRVHR